MGPQAVYSRQKNACATPQTGSKRLTICYYFLPRISFIRNCVTREISCEFSRRPPFECRYFWSICVFKGDVRIPCSGSFILVFWRNQFRLIPITGAENVFSDSKSTDSKLTFHLFFPLLFHIWRKKKTLFQPQLKRPSYFNHPPNCRTSFCPTGYSR